MSRKLFWLKLIVLPALLVLSLGSIQAQITGFIPVFVDEIGTEEASVIFQDFGTGNVGIGTTTPVEKLVVQTAPGSYGFVHTAGDFSVGSWAGTGTSGSGGWYGTKSNHPLHFFTANGPTRMTIATDGNVGIGTTNPAKKLDVQGGSMRVFGKLGTRGFDPDSGYPAGIDGGVHTWDVYAEGLVGVGQGGSLNAFMRNDGVAAVRILQITSGADLSEKFEVAHAQNKIEPGMVVAIDPANPGKLAVSAQAYDRRVAGILSGAGGVQPGMLMGQTGTLADGSHPVALTGRVYVWADASNGPIAPGDLLTTSNVPGHAMKVTNYNKAQGAIIGKAMTGLKEGKGLVLVLVTLQ